jgi:hypothetical protein
LVGRGGPADETQRASVGTGQEVPDAVANRGSEVLSADFADGTAGTVFTVEGAAGEAPVAVVWINDEELPP